jgi:hypothetical protein
MVKIVVEPPQQSRPGGHFNHAVQAETDERDGPGDQSGDDGNQTFGAVVDDGEVFEPLAPAYQFTAVRRDRDCHRFIIPPEALSAVTVVWRHYSPDRNQDAIRPSTNRTAASKGMGFGGG